MAEPREPVELSGFLGVDQFADDVGLGGSPAPEQRPQSAPTFGVRLSWLPIQLGGDIHLDLGVEAEIAFTPSWTGYGFDGPRPSVFAPVFGMHGNAIIRLGGGWFQPHVTAGGGSATVTSSSKFMADDTDPVFLWGVGASLPAADRWLLRFDARQVIMESSTGGTTRSYEAHVSVGARFGAARRAVIKQVEVVDATPPPPPDGDRDGDGIIDRLDACPDEPGIAATGGCPEPDPDGDGIVGALDQCPDQPEDRDGFQDDDGCPDLDNDGDGIPDAQDACPDEPETFNGYADTDGCADEIPESIKAALRAVSAVKFEAGKVRLSTASKHALDEARLPMLEHPRMKFTITVHADKASDAKAEELARKRADVVKWYLTEQGVAADNLTTVVGPARTDRKAPIVVLSITQ
jgi:outer membrane protein OmpA-like peptidoglycan-associated protein